MPLQLLIIAMAVVNGLAWYIAGRKVGRDRGYLDGYRAGLDQAVFDAEMDAANPQDIHDIHVCSPQTCGAVYDHEEDGL